MTNRERRWLRDHPRPRILVAVLSGTERTNWINPFLCVNLLEIANSPGFEVTVKTLLDLRPFEHARNLALVLARDGGFDWCFQIDNDEAFRSNPLQWLCPGKDVIAIPALRYEGRAGLQIDLRGKIYEKDPEGFCHVEATGTGAMMISKRVWEAIPRGPWFRHVMNEESELQDYKLAESFYFCRFVADRGLKVWAAPDVARHFHVTDLLWMSEEVERRTQAKLAAPKVSTDSLVWTARRPATPQERPDTPRFYGGAGAPTAGQEE